MEALAQLEEYLRYMQSLNITGLALEKSPFVVPKAQAPSIAAVPPPSTGPIGKPPKIDPVSKKEAKKAPPPKKIEMPNLISIMNMVSSVPSIDTGAMANVSGNSKIEVLRNLYKAFHQCQGCALGTTRNRFVFGEGPPEAELMFIGEAPGLHEDRSGRPFIDEAGKLLTSIIQAMGFEREKVFISTIVKCRPPDNRAPLADELKACSPLLEKQIETINPKVIVALGATPLRFFKGQDVSLQRMRGQFFQWKQYQVMPTFPPQFVLRNPRSKREVWADVQKVMAVLKK